MIGLAVGIDYALFIVSRYRSELAEGRDREEAVGRAVGTAGSAVVFAGPHRRHRPGRARGRRHPDADQDGPRRGRHGRGRRPHRADPDPRAARLRRQEGPGTGEKRGSRGSEAAAPVRPHRPAAKPGPGVRWARFVIRRPAAVLLLGVLGPGRDRRPRRPAGAGPARRRLAADVHHPAPGLRPALRRLRPRLQRPPDDRGRRSQQRRPAGGGRRGGQRDQGPRGRRHGDPGRLQQGRRHRDDHRDPGLQAARRPRPRTWSTPSATRAPRSGPTRARRCWSPAPPR